MGEHINKGFIKSLHKDADKKQVKNWRTITLFNLSYKIIAKPLADRLPRILGSIAFVTQTSFIQRRYILENLNTSWEAMN